jgi:hypothetical protein
MHYNVVHQGCRRKRAGLTDGGVEAGAPVISRSSRSGNISAKKGECGSGGCPFDDVNSRLTSSYC